ncbi:restriction endonuclease subunit S [Glaesserella parasuis]|uniref:restriction endonuclease subunit S n=1 Tax=Glaesserella parasuis TaxID=738 RepID=UPI0013DEE212|nr:restriction endonuclease subunit S [Glaesserella parasuis]QIE74662.1 restriction endonuclease subunit S [Glaesserella parasuis]
MSSLKCRLGDIAHIVMGQSPSGDEVNAQYLGIPLLNGPSEFTEFYPIPVQYTECGRKFAEQGDLLFCVRGSTTGKMNIADQKYAIGRGLAAISGKNGYSTEYIKIILEQNLEKILRSATGSTFPNVGRDLLCDLEVAINSVDVAENISQISATINKKIQLNTQINQTLEQIAQTIFKSWFIDFDPVHAKANALASGQTTEQATQAAMAVISGKNTQELHRLQTANPEQYQQLWEIAEAFPSGFDEEGVPRGWSIKYFKDITSLYIDNRGKTPPIEESGIPLLEVKHLPEHSIFPNLKTEKYISDDIYDSWLRQKLEPLDIVISTVGTIGRISLIPFNKKVAIAQNILGFRFKQNVTNQVFMFYQMKSHKFNFDVEARLVETVQKSIKRKDLETIPLIIPDLKLQKFFEKMVLPTILKQDNENETLEKTRDELLPKLLSGELNGLPEKTI